MIRPRSLLGELCLLAAVVLAVALVANAVHPRPIDWGRDYFPANTLGAPASGDGAADGAAARDASGAGQGAGADAPPQHGFQVLTLEDVELYAPYAGPEDPGVVFLDARSEKKFRAGHIPGALLCDHYQQDAWLPKILDRLKAADIVVIYCAGGDCEDSIQLATDLVYRHGLAQNAIAIYEGGWEEWRAEGGAAEEGAPR